MSLAHLKGKKITAHTIIIQFFSAIFGPTEKSYDLIFMRLKKVRGNFKYCFEKNFKLSEKNNDFVSIYLFLKLFDYANLFVLSNKLENVICVILILIIRYYDNQGVLHNHDYDSLMTTFVKITCFPLQFFFICIFYSTYKILVS